MSIPLFLDYFLSCFHLFFLFFNLFGWILSVRWHLLCVGSTAFSWIGLGVYYGWGYCFLTDWHWRIKESLGEIHLPASYISYILSKYLRLKVSDEWINLTSAVVFPAVFILSVMLNVRARKRSSSQNL